MNQTLKRTLVGALLGCAATTTQNASAGGIGLYEIATPDLGLASAGYSARAQDASTLFKNPAGMSQLQGPQLQTGLQMLYGSVEFNADGDTSPRLGNDEGGNALGFMPGASTFIVIPIGEKIRAGLGLFSYFGLAEDFNDDWVGRYYVQKGAVLGLSLMPSLSYEITDWLSVGAGLNAMYGYLNTDIAVNNIVGRDGQMSLEDRAWGFGANVGVLIKASENTRFGVTYLSPVQLDFSDKPHFNNLGPGLSAVLSDPRTLDLGLTVPQSLMAGVYHTLNERWGLMADVGWQDWSEFGYVQAGVENGGTTTVDLQYKDTWHGALGAQYRPAKQWLFSAGAAFDSSAVDSENRSVTLPLGRTWRFGLGGQYQLSEDINLGAGVTFAWSGDMSVDQGQDGSLRGRVSGSFDNTWLTFASLNLNWNF